MKNQFRKQKYEVRLDDSRLKAATIPKLFTLLGLIAFLGATGAQAANDLWLTNPTTGNWGTGANWFSTTVPVGGDSLEFTNSSITALTNNIVAGTSFSGITFDTGASAYTIGLNALVLTGGITNKGASIETLNFGITNNTAGVVLTNSTTGSIVLGGTIAGTGGFTLGAAVAGGIVQFNSANTYSGGTTLNSGILALNGTTGSVGTGTLNLAGGALAKIGTGSQALTTANALNVTGTTLLSAANTGNWALTGAVTGSGTINLNNLNNGAGAPATTTVIFAGDMSGFSGTFAQTSGNTRLRFGPVAAGNGTGIITENLTNATLNLSGSTTTGASSDVQDGYNATVNLGALTGTGGFFNASWALATNVVTTNNTFLNVGFLNTTTTFAGALQDNLGTNHSSTGGHLILSKVGTGTLTLSNTNPYSGTTTVENGALIAGTNSLNGAAGAFGNTNSAIVLGDATSISNNLNPQLLIGGAFTVGRAITVGANTNATTGSFTIGGTTANTASFTNTVTLNQNLSVTQVTGGTLGVGAITSGSVGSQTLTFNNAGSVNATNVIGGGSGTISLVQSGAGTTALSGVNTYTGKTTISAGALALTTNGSLASTNIALASGAFSLATNYTLTAAQTLSGSGSVTLAGASSLTLNGNLTPGGASRGLINVNGALTLGSNAVSTLTINKAGTAGTDYDAVHITNSLFEHGTLSLVYNGTNVPVGTFTLFTAGSYSGDFTNVALAGSWTNAAFTQAGSVWSLTGSQQSWSLNDLNGTLTVSAVPEPSTWALFALSGLVLVGVSRRRVS